MSTMAAGLSPPHPLGPSRQPGASALPASRPPFPIYVLSHGVDIAEADLTGKPDPGRGWSEIPCASRRAYGCGDKIQEAAQGLVLYARLGDGPKVLNSFLAIRMTEGARRRFESELDSDYYRRRDAELSSNMIARAFVEMAEEQGVTVIVLSFTRPSTYEQPHILYYLVYDCIDRSLSMFQIVPDPYKGAYEGIYTLRPIVPKRTGRGGDYKLLLVGHDEVSSRKDVLWVRSLSSSHGTGLPSKLKNMDFPQGIIHEPFNVDVAFSCQGKAFWGDLKQGLLYFDLQTSDLGFVKLPREYKKVDVKIGDEFVLPVKNTRTMGCVGDSVWFVCIDIPSHYTNAVVCIWELVFPEEKGKGKAKAKATGKGTVKVMGKGVEWKEVGEEVPAKVLWELSSFKKAGLPAAPFQYPILMPDGALCFVLVDQNPKQCALVDHFCIFDIHCKSLLWHGLVHSYPIYDTIIMYTSSSFLDEKQCSRASSAEDCSTPGLEAMAWSKLVIG